MQPLKVFIGMDRRQPIAYTVCRSSIERHASARVSIEPIRIEWTPVTRRGLTDFTFARYAVPWLCDYRGVAIFMDADVIVLGDIHELAAHADPHPVSVVKGKVKFEWPSVMVFRCDLCEALTPEYINDQHEQPQLLGWASKIGELSAQWNHCVGYDEPRSDAKLVHYTAGIPCWPETRGCEYSAQWHEEMEHACSTVGWAELMGRSVHAEMVRSGHLQRHNGQAAA